LRLPEHNPASVDQSHCNSLMEADRSHACAGRIIWADCPADGSDNPENGDESMTLAFGPFKIEEGCLSPRQLQEFYRLCDSLQLTVWANISEGTKQCFRNGGSQSSRHQEHCRAKPCRHRQKAQLCSNKHECSHCHFHVLRSQQLQKADPKKPQHVAKTEVFQYLLQQDEMEFQSFLGEVLRSRQCLAGGPGSAYYGTPQATASRVAECESGLTTQAWCEPLWMCSPVVSLLPSQQISPSSIALYQSSSESESLRQRVTAESSSSLEDHTAPRRQELRHAGPAEGDSAGEGR